MSHIVDDWLAEADAAILLMQQAALHARNLHARAELMRHMRGTAAKMRARPLDEAAVLVAGEWMKAWHLDDSVYQAVATPVQAFTRAFCNDAVASDAATQTTLREAADALDAALLGQGTSIADQMAWRSECAYGWWEMVKPTPLGLPHRAPRDAMPKYQQGTEFWETACQTRCRPT